MEEREKPRLHHSKSCSLRYVKSSRLGREVDSKNEVVPWCAKEFWTLLR
jgi:hypothetical protein